MMGIAWSYMMWIEMIKWIFYLIFIHHFYLFTETYDTRWIFEYSKWIVHSMCIPIGKKYSYLTFARPWHLSQNKFSKTDEFKMNSLRIAFQNLTFSKQLLVPRNQLAVLNIERLYHSHDIPTPKPGHGKQYRRYVIIIIHVIEVMFS